MSAEDIAAKTPILTDAHKQRVLWARVTAIKHLLVKAGLTTNEEFDTLVRGMVNDLDASILRKTRRDLGLEE